MAIGRTAPQLRLLVTLTPAKLLLRCYAEHVGEQWQALCLDLTLASQADSFEEARDKLHAMIVDYVTDAVAGEDQAHAGALLSRRAPLRYWLKYYAVGVLIRLGATGNKVRLLFTEPLPLVLPQHG